MNKIPIGISACLLGHPVRYNGGHKKSSYCTESLSSVFEFTPMCPEIGIGLGAPRSAIHLVGDADKPQAITLDERRNVTQELKNYVGMQHDTLANLHGFIVMRRSPSCGMERVKLYNESDQIKTETSSGIFTHTLMQRYPNLPVEEEGRLHNAEFRENFFLRVYAHYNWHHVYLNILSVKNILSFHTDYKLLLLAHSPMHYQTLGQLLSKAGHHETSSLAKKYFDTFMLALKQTATRQTHTNVLMHLLGFFKKHLPHPIKHDLLNTIEQYYQGIIPLIVPITLFRHHLTNFPQQYLAQQKYLFPYPDHLKLRNEI